MQKVVTMEEAGKVLSTGNMKNDKSPGSDGFSVNFFIIILNSRKG